MLTLLIKLNFSAYENQIIVEKWEILMDFLCINSFIALPILSWTVPSTMCRSGGGADSI